MTPASVSVGATLTEAGAEPETFWTDVLAGRLPARTAGWSGRFAGWTKVVAGRDRH